MGGKFKKAWFRLFTEHFDKVKVKIAFTQGWVHLN